MKFFDKLKLKRKEEDEEESSPPPLEEDTSVKFFDGDGNVWREEKYTLKVAEAVEEEKEKVGEIVDEPKLGDVVYSSGQREFIQLAINKLRTDKINLLFSGYAGTGKTYSSKMIACETGKPFVYMTGSMGKSRIVDMLLNLKPDALVLIDEIHNLSERVAEILYPAIEYGEIYLDGVRKLVDCCFIGTTTEPEKLPRPLQDRFMRIEFEEPSDELTREILNKMKINQEMSICLMRYTTNIRVLKKLIAYVKMYGVMEMENLHKVFKMMKINSETGMSEEQDKYIAYLKKVEKASIRNLSLVLRRSENYVKLDIEPELIKKGIINITSRGRELVIQ